MRRMLAMVALAAGCHLTIDVDEYSFEPAIGPAGGGGDGGGGAGGGGGTSTSSVGGTGGDGAAGATTSSTGGATSCQPLLGEGGFLGPIGAEDCSLAPQVASDTFDSAAASNGIWRRDFDDDSSTIEVCDGALRLQPGAERAFWFIGPEDGGGGGLQSDKAPAIFQRVCDSFGIAMKGRVTDGNGQPPAGPFSGLAFFVLEDTLEPPQTDLQQDLQTWMLFSMGHQGIASMEDRAIRVWAFANGVTQHGPIEPLANRESAFDGEMVMCRLDSDSWFFEHRANGVMTTAGITIPDAFISIEGEENCCFDVGVTAHRFHEPQMAPGPLEAEVDWVRFETGITTEEDCRDLLDAPQ